jgi:hypothetical protein
MACAWILSLQIGAAQASEQVNIAVHSVKESDPSHPEWSTHVERRILMLVKSTMPCLSQWGSGMAAIMIVCWVGAIGLLFVYSHQGVTVFFTCATACFLLIPLVLAWPLAMTSTNSIALMAALNNKRVSNLNLPTEFLALENMLRQLNNNRGPSFTIAGTIIDTRLLLKLIGGILSLVIAIMPRLLENTERDQPCGLDHRDIAMLRALFSDKDITCYYNLTLGDIMRPLDNSGL